MRARHATWGCYDVGMALIAKSPHHAEIGREDIPPLENGNHLTREEFERRWGLHPETKQAAVLAALEVEPEE